MVARHGVGLDYIPVETCTELGIPVVFTPDANTESVAEHVVGTMIVLVTRSDTPIVRCGPDGGMRAIGYWESTFAAERSESLAWDVSERVLPKSAAALFDARLSV